jgi:hypothetical protein
MWWNFFWSKDPKRFLALATQFPGRLERNRILVPRLREIVAVANGAVYRLGISLAK